MNIRISSLNYGRQTALKLKIGGTQSILIREWLKRQIKMNIELPQNEIAEFCMRWGIVKLELFGSALRADFRPDSDFDFLYTPGPSFRRDQAYGPWLKDNMADELSALLGRKVDLIERDKMERHRNWIRREHVLRTAQPIYVER